jgi:peptide/nickel transport system ATP-binding protein
MAGGGTVQLRDSDDVVLRVENLVMEFPAGLHQVVHAVSDVSFDVCRGETLGIVGESGCGKSTTARALVQLPRPTSGTVVLDPGADGEVKLTDLEGEDLRCVRPRVQMIFQDPISSLNPRRRVKDIIGEGLAIWSEEHPDVDVAARVDEVLSAVGLDPVVAGSRRPMSSPVASVSAFPSPVPSPSTLRSSSATSPFRHWTSRSRPRFSTSSRR